MLFSSARARLFDDESVEDLEKSSLPSLREPWTSTIADRVLAAERQRGQWSTPARGPEPKHHSYSYGLHRSVEESYDLSAISPTTEGSRSECICLESCQSC